MCEDLTEDVKLAKVRDASFNEFIDCALLIEQADEEKKEEKWRNRRIVDQENFLANHGKQCSNNKKRK